MSTPITGRISRNTTARIAGGVFLSFIVASALASIVGRIGLSDADDLVEAITTNASVFRLGLVIALASALLFLLAAWCLYVLLRPVDPHLALLFLLLNAVGVAIQCLSMLPLIFALLLADPASHLAAFSSEQATGLAYLSVGTYKLGFATAQVFFSTWLFPLGYLVFRSGFLPRVLGVLLILDGFADLFWFIQAVLLPDHPQLSYPSWVVSFVAEVGLALWLLIKGAKGRPMQASAAAAGD